MDRYTFTKKRDAASLYYAKHQAWDVIDDIQRHGLTMGYEYVIDCIKIGAVRWYIIGAYDDRARDVGYLIDKGEPKCKHS